MRRCEIAVGLVGVAVWSIVYALVSFVIFLTLAVPFALLFVLDALAGEGASDTADHAPPAPPQQPVAVTSTRRSLAA
jgi:hypothetical protein